MRFTYLLLLIVSATHLCVDAAYGGSYYPITEAPYLAQLNVKSPDMLTYCGAVILNEYWVASAAHCVVKDTELNVTIRLGTSSRIDKGILINATDIVVHDKYKAEPMAFDISLIKAERKIEFNEYFYPIPISRTPPVPGNEITVPGYGFSHFMMFEQALKISHLHVIEDEICRRNFTIDKTQFCTNINDGDLCFGDSGSPAVFNDELVGIASQGCEYDAPVVFIKVSEFYDWILEKTGIEYGERDE